MAEDCHVPVGDSPKKPIGLSLHVQLGSAMGARYDKIETLEQLIGAIQRTVGQNIGFDALQNPEGLVINLPCQSIVRRISPSYSPEAPERLASVV
jgi:hypothetical protein